MSTSIDSAPRVTSAARRALREHGGPARPAASPRLVLSLILVAQLMLMLDTSIVNIALPEIRSGLGFSTESLSWVINAYTLAFGGLLLLGARAGDILGRRRTFLIGIALFSLASLAGGLASTSGELLVARAVQGIGAALASPSILALLMTMFTEPKARVRAVGLYSAISVSGAAVGLIAGGMLVQWASWRWVMFVNVPIGLVLLVLGRRSLPETPRQRGHFDLQGAVTSVVGVTLLVYGFVHAASDGWAQAETLGSFALGAAFMAAFVLIETRAEAPITPLRLVLHRNRAASYIGRLLLTAGMFGMFFFLSQFLQQILGYSPLESGLAFLPLTVMLFGASQFSARVLSDRIAPNTAIVGGLLVSTVSMLWLSQLSEQSSYLSVLGPLVLFGLGNGIAFVPLTALSLSDVRPADAGAASGLVNVMQQVGGSLGLAVLITVFSAASSGAGPHGDAAQSAQHAFIVGADRGFLVAGALLAATVVLTAVMVRTRRPAPVDVTSDVSPGIGADEAAGAVPALIPAQAITD